MTQEQRDKLLLSMNEDNKQRDKLLLSMNEKIASMNEELLSMKEEISSVKGKVDTLTTRVSVLEKDVAEIKEENRSISRSVARLEVNVERGLELLVDGYNGIQEKLESFDIKFKSNEEQLSKHDDRIWRLESKFGIA